MPFQFIGFMPKRSYFGYGLFDLDAIHVVWGDGELRVPMLGDKLHTRSPGNLLLTNCPNHVLGRQYCGVGNDLWVCGNG